MKYCDICEKRVEEVVMMAVPSRYAASTSNTTMYACKSCVEEFKITEKKNNIEKKKVILKK